MADWLGLDVNAADMGGQELAGDRQAQAQNDARRLVERLHRSIRDVIGQTIAMTAFSVNAAGETTRVRWFRGSGCLDSSG
jgi:hypothetical protein